MPSLTLTDLFLLCLVAVQQVAVELLEFNRLVILLLEPFLQPAQLLQVTLLLGFQLDVLLDQEGDAVPRSHIFSVVIHHLDVC